MPWNSIPSVVTDEFRSYSRELNEQGQATDKIKDKNLFHGLDSARYLFCNIGTVGDYRTPYEFQDRAVPTFINTGIFSAIKDRAEPPQYGYSKKW